MKQQLLDIKKLVDQIFNYKKIHHIYEYIHKSNFLTS
jgi:hypothetical protein